MHEVEVDVTGVTPDVKPYVRLDVTAVGTDDAFFDDEFIGDRVAREGSQQGLIVDVVKRPDITVKTAKPAEWIGIVVELDENDDLGKPFLVQVEVTRSMARKSNLRNLIARLLPPSGKMNIRHKLMGLAVDCNVHHKLGGNRNYPFAKIAHDEIWLRGQGKPPKKRGVYEIPINDPIRAIVVAPMPRGVREVPND